MVIDEKKSAELALALMSLTAYKDGPNTRVWKSVDWDIAAQMYQQEWIFDPVGKSKSIILTDKGIAKSAEFRSKYLSRDEDDSKLLTELEHGMWEAAKRYDESWFRGCLHPEFIEIGRSGRRYKYDDMFPVVSGELDCKLPLPNFQIRYITNTVALINYESHLHVDGETLSAKRTSVWLKEGGMWLMRHHQGTQFDASSDK